MSAYSVAAARPAPPTDRFARLYGGVAASAALAGSPGRWSTGVVLDSARRYPQRLARYATRVQSETVRDALALAVTAGRLDWSSLHDAVVGGDEVTAAFPGSSPEGWAAVALSWAARLDGSGLIAAADLYGLLARDGSLWELAGLHQALALQSHYLTGRHAEVAELLPRCELAPDLIRAFTALDLERPEAWDAPGQGASPAAVSRWGDHLTRLAFGHHRGVAVGAGGGEAGTAAFDRLESRGHRPASVSGELVTVIVPSYRPEPAGLRLAVRSMLEQTWADLDIIVVDDCSGPGHDDLYAEIEASDPRVRVLRMPENGGSYLGRNAALRIARGAAVTFQDSDDWSHPCRVEDQVRALAQAPRVGASRSLAVRAREDLSHQWLGYSPVRPNASSLMVSRATIERLGDFLPIRRGADSEYAERVAAAGGAIVDTDTPLAITRLRSGSLSRGDFSYQWTTPQRLAFKGLYRGWHARAGAEELRVDASEGVPFPVPAAFDVHPLERRYELVVVADLSESVSDLLGADTEEGLRHDATAAMTLDASWRGSRADVLRAALSRARAGVTVALWHVEAPHRRTPRGEMHASWFDLVVDGTLAGAVSGNEPVHAGRLLVADPRPMAVRPAEPVHLVADRVVVVVPQPPAGPVLRRRSDVDEEVVADAVAALRSAHRAPLEVVGAGSAQCRLELGLEGVREQSDPGHGDV